MADKIPQFSEEQPVLKPVAIESSASGYEEFAKTLGALAHTAESKTEELVEEQSNAMLMQSSAQAANIKTDAEINMIKHPDQTDKILNNTTVQLDQLNTQSFLNDKDRKKLAYLNNQDFNALKLKAAGVAYDQATKGAAINFWDNYPVVMTQLESALRDNDSKKIKILEDTLHNTSLEAAKAGVITPEQYASVRKSNYDLYGKYDYLLNKARSADGMTARDFHAASMTPFDSGVNINHPVDQNTQWLVSHYNNDRTMGGQFSALYNDEPINYGVVAQGGDEEYNKFVTQMAGVNSVKGHIRSNGSFAQIDAEMKALEAHPKLSSYEEGQVNYWKSFKTRLAKGDGYLQMMSDTVLGAKATQDYNNNSVAIMNSYIRTEDQKREALRNNDNDYIGKMVSLGQSMDHKFVQPIFGKWVNEVQSSFSKDAPVTPALERIAYIKPEYRAYLANTMEKPNQSVAVYLAGNTLEKANTNFPSQLIEANQDRDYSSLLKTGKDETKDANIWDDIANESSIKDIYAYMGKLPGGDTAQNGFKSAAINYVLYRAAKEGDVNLNGKGKYEQDFINNVSKGFNIAKGNRYSFNSNMLNIRQIDMDYLADYALTIAHQNIHEGRSEEDYQSYIDLNPLQVTNTPDNRIVVIDKEGHAAVDGNGYTAFDKPYTSNMLALAHATARPNRIALYNYYGFSENAMHGIYNKIAPNFDKEVS